MQRSLPLRRTALLGTLLLGIAGCARETVPSYVVFFTAASTELDDSARQVITQAAQAARASGNRNVRVEGYAGVAGTEQNRILSQQRAQVVTDALTAQGVARDRIVLRPRGQQEGDPGVEGRRVEVNITVP